MSKTDDKTSGVSRSLDGLVLFSRAMMIFTAMNMVAVSQSPDEPLWLYLTYQPIAFASIWVALLLGKQNRGLSRKD